MSASRNSFSKFTLKPSSLSQHTANFNKILEQVPVPKIDSLELLKPSTLKPTITTEKQDETSSKVVSDQVEKCLNNTNETEVENVASVSSEPVKGFVFGEKLTDRVINVSSSGETNGSDSCSQNSNKNLDQKEENSATEAKSALWSAETDAEKYSDAIENNEANTILKLNNCKLYILETEKANWIERGYGILKVIDSNDKMNCKIMMWTDKCFRLILNTKLFEKMEIDRANKKSIRFNAFDNGKIRIFLVKAANPNDCDELYTQLKIRLNEYNLRVLKEVSVNANKNQETSSVGSQSNNEKKNILFECKCDLINNLEEPSANDETFKSNESVLQLYNYSSHAENLTNSNSHQLLLDILDKNDKSKILLSTFLKLVKLKKHKTKEHSHLELEIHESFMLTSSKSTHSKLKYQVFLNNKEESEKFLSYYKKEPKFCLTSKDENEEFQDSEESENSLENIEDENENDSDEVIKKTDSTNDSTRFESSSDEFYEKNKNHDDSQNEITENAKKRKIEPKNEESFEKQEDLDSSSNDTNKFSKLKRNNSDIDSSQNTQDKEEHTFKKTKVSENEPELD